MQIRTLSRELWLPRRIDAIFDFFSDAGNLEALTPPWLHFQIITPQPVALQLGSIIEYRIRWRQIPLYWRTEIAAWEPPNRFIDQQIQGPYRRWIHEHTFVEREGGTLLRDHVEYAVPGWIIEPAIERWIVRPDLARIFDYRREKMINIFGQPVPAPSSLSRR